MEKLMLKIAVKVSMAFVVLCLAFFLPAGTVCYWHAWVYWGILLFPMGFILIYLLRHDRELLARRMKTGEKEKPQKLIIKIGLLASIAPFLLPGFDFRYGWSLVPFVVVLFADIVFLFSYYLFFLTLKENSYASRIIDVEKGQKVISTGPYAYIRHPMYLAILFMMCFTPLCLGSYWGMLTSIPIVLVIVFRILNEEKVLAENLPGYKEYLQKTRYRLIPGLW